MKQALALPLMIFALLCLTACAVLQQQSFDQRLQLAVETHTAVTRGVTTALERRQISVEDAKAYERIATEARGLLDAARVLGPTDEPAARDKLGLALDILTRLESFLTARQQT